jgi:hypothetical protein
VDVEQGICRHGLPCLTASHLLAGAGARRVPELGKVGRGGPAWTTVRGVSGGPRLGPVRA